jgi:hypothetical protein
MGSYEIATSTMGSIMILLCFAAFFPSIFEVIFTIWLGLYTLFQSLLSCSLISSLGTVKRLALSRKENQSHLVVLTTG